MTSVDAKAVESYNHISLFYCITCRLHNFRQANLTNHVLYVHFSSGLLVIVYIKSTKRTNLTIETSLFLLKPVLKLSAISAQCRNLQADMFTEIGATLYKMKEPLGKQSAIFSDILEITH